MTDRTAGGAGSSIVNQLTLPALAQAAIAGAGAAAGEGRLTALIGY